MTGKQIPNALGVRTPLGTITGMYVEHGMIYVNVDNCGILRVVLSDVKAAMPRAIAAEVEQAVRATCHPAYLDDYLNS